MLCCSTATPASAVGTPVLGTRQLLLYHISDLVVLVITALVALQQSSFPQTSPCRGWVGISPANRPQTDCLFGLDQAQEHRQKHQAVQSPHNHNRQVHSEVVHLKDLGPCKRKDKDAQELCQCDSREDLIHKQGK